MYDKQTAFDGQVLLLITCKPPTGYTKSGSFTPFMIAQRNFGRLSSIASYSSRQVGIIHLSPKVLSRIAS
jgi:hypothetical protein